MPVRFNQSMVYCKYYDNDYYRLFIDLGIKIEPLNEGYDPNEFGKELLAGYHYEEGVSYSASTTIIEQDADVESTSYILQ